MGQTPTIRPVPIGPAMEEATCPLCGAPAVKLLGYHLLQPPPIPEGQEPTEEQIAQQLQGSKLFIRLACCACQKQYCTVYWQQPQQACKLVLADAAGNPVQLQDLAQMRARHAATQSIIVPGRRH